jgi:hypothetical protein
LTTYALSSFCANAAHIVERFKLSSLQTGRARESIRPGVCNDASFAMGHQRPFGTENVLSVVHPSLTSDMAIATAEKCQQQTSISRLLGRTIGVRERGSVCLRVLNLPDDEADGSSLYRSMLALHRE